MARPNFHSRFISCINQGVKDGFVSRETAQRVKENFTREYKHASKQPIIYDEAVARAVKREEIRNAVKRMNLYRQNLKNIELKGMSKTEIRRLFNRTANRAVSSYDYYKRKIIDSLGEKLKRNIFTGKVKFDNKIMVKAVSYVLTGKGDGLAKDVGEAMREIFKNIHARLREVGKVVGEQSNFFPQGTHNKKLISSAGFNKWRADTEPLLDWNRIEAESGKGFDRDSFLQDVYNNLSKEPNAPVKGKRSKVRSLDFQRKLHFTDDNWLKYNRLYGVGDEGLFDILENYMRTQTKDIAVISEFGPIPRSGVATLKHQNKGKGFLFIEQNANHLINPILYSDDAFMTNMSEAARQVLRSAQLGSAGLAALLTDGFYTASASVLNGLPQWRAMSYWFKGVVGTDEATREVAKRNAVGLDIFTSEIHDAVQRAGTPTNKGFKVTRFLQDLTFSLGLLNRVTRASKRAASAVLSSTLSDMRHIPYDKLNRDFVDLLNKGNISRADWDIIRRVEPSTVHGNKFLTIDDMVEAKVPNEIREKVGSLHNELATVSANEPGAIIKSHARGSNAFTQELKGWFFLYKSFPTSVLLSHFHASIKQGKTANLAFMVAATGLMGVARLKFNQLLSGETPTSEISGDDLRRGLIYGGFFGLVGDYFLQNPREYGSDILTHLAGPGAGLAQQSYDLFANNITKASKGEETKVAVDALRIIRKHMPLGNLWYLKLATERLIWNNINEAVDPKYYQKQARKMNRVYGENRDFWLEP